MPVNKYLPAINLFFVLTIAVITTLSVKIWTHPTYPTRVDGASVVGSPKSLKKLTVSRLGGNAGTVSQVVQGNIFRRQRREYIPPPTARPIVPSVASKPALPPPNLVLKGILMLGGTKIAILEGNYWTFQGNQKVKKKVKKKGYSLGQIVGDFELTEIDKTSVTLNDKNGRGVRLRLAKRSPEKIIHRRGDCFFSKKLKSTIRENSKPLLSRIARQEPLRQNQKPSQLHLPRLQPLCSGFREQKHLHLLPFIFQEDKLSC